MSTHDVKITFRIPGPWKHPMELVDALPEGYSLEESKLVSPEGHRFDIYPVPADEQFPDVFLSSCRRHPTPELESQIQSYAGNAILTGSGGSLVKVRSMMAAGNAICKAGGHGVFIDSCGLAHAAADWSDMAESGEPEAATFAIVGLIGNEADVRTMGMQSLGLSDLIMSREPERSGEDKTESRIIDILNYLARDNPKFADGHVICSQHSPEYKAIRDDCGKFEASSPFFNPWGRLRLLSFDRIAESN